MNKCIEEFQKEDATRIVDLLNDICSKRSTDLGKKDVIKHMIKLLSDILGLFVAENIPKEVYEQVTKIIMDTIIYHLNRQHDN